MAEVIKKKKEKGKKNGKTWCAPGRDSGLAGCTDEVTFHRFPQSEKRKKEWISKVPRINWLPSKDSRLCEKHFTPESYKTNREDTKNPWRAKKKGELNIRPTKDACFR